MGYPLIRIGWGYPLPPSEDSSRVSTCYAAGGVTVEFTQEDFLVPCFHCNVNLCYNITASVNSRGFEKRTRYPPYVVMFYNRMLCGPNLTVLSILVGHSCNSLFRCGFSEYVCSPS